MSSSIVDFNTQYTQAYNELRRYRDYELQAAGWFAVLQIGLATLAWRDLLFLHKNLDNNGFAQFVFTALVYLIGVSGVISVSFAQARYQALQNATVRRFGEAYTWTNLPKASGLVKPVNWIIGMLGLLSCVYVGALILQLELRISEGAGAFRPLKTGQKETAFRPGPLSSGQIQL
jgi:hypothetical protein